MIDAARIGFDPAVAPGVLAGLAVLCLACLGVYAWKRARALHWRALGLLLLLLGLAQPLWVRETRAPTQDIAAVLVDQSESLALAGRLEAARAAAEAVAARLAQEEGLEVRVREVASGPDGTPLAGALQDALADAPRDRIAGAILITDGQAADMPEDPADLAGLGPVHAIIIGDPQRGDRRLRLIEAPRFGVVGEMVEITAQVDDPTPGVRVQVQTAVDGAAVTAQTVRAGEPFTVRLRTPRRGETMITLEAAQGPQEIVASNNRAAVALTGVRDRLRVLLVTGEPHAGARVWRNLLKSDPAVDLVHFTILRPPDKQDFTPPDELSLIPFPTRQLFIDRLDGFDLIIFDRYRELGILENRYFANIARRVQAGGALLLTTGDAEASYGSLFDTPLATILPGRPTGAIQDGPYRPQPTQTGARHPILRGLPPPPAWGRWTRLVGADAGRGLTLLAAEDGRPVLTIDRAGRGRVAAFWTDQVWLWARGYDGGGPHGELLRRLIHWMMQEPELEDERLTLSAGPEGLIIERSTLGPAPAAATLIDPSGQTRLAPLTEQAPGVYRAVAPARGFGLYEARAGELRAFAAVGPLNPQEAAAVGATDAILRPLVEASRGGVAFAGETGRALPEIRRVEAGARAADDGWIGLERNDAYVVRTATAEPLGPGWLWAALGLFLFMAGWRRESR